MKNYIKNEIFKNSKFNYYLLIKTLLFNPSHRFVFLVRLMFWFKKSERIRLANIIHRRLIYKYGCYISFDSIIGMGIQFPHPNGIVIGKKTRIGENCIIYQQVTFGGKVIGDSLKSNYPELGNNVTVFAGAKLIGNIKIGNNVVVGANSVVNKDISSNSIIAGVPARVVKNIPEV